MSIVVPANRAAVVYMKVTASHTNTNVYATWESEVYDPEERDHLNGSGYGAASFGMFATALEIIYSDTPTTITMVHMKSGTGDPVLGQPPRPVDAAVARRCRLTPRRARGRCQ